MNKKRDASGKEELLRLIERNSRIELKDLAVCLKKDEADIANMLQELEQDGTISGYLTLINWENTTAEKTDALIEVHVNTGKDVSFDTIAALIYQYEEVKSCYLISGGYDFLVLIEGKTMREVAYFVSSKLSQLEFVTGTATHFIMKRYKEFGTVLGEKKIDGRERISL